MSIFKGIFRKERRGKEAPPMPSWEETVKQMYDRGLEAFADEVVRVIYSKDRSMRYVILKDEKGVYCYCLEAIYPFDGEEWSYLCESTDVPAMWEPHPEDRRCSLFDTEEHALRELMAEPYYKQYFEGMAEALS